MKICVVALGKIGLPLAVQFATKGHEVIGTDINEKVVDLVNAGVEPFPGEAELDVKLKQVVESGNLRATTDTTAAVAESEAVVVVVPLVVDEHYQPDFGPMEAATRAIAKGLKPGTLVCYETTTPLGVTRNRYQPLLEEISGLKVGRDFYLCHSPERVFTGRVFADLRKYPKLVGGVDEASARKAVEFYQAVLDFDPRPDLARPNGVWDLGSAEAAELAKLAETTYRDVNIGLANQFARFAEKLGVDIYRVIEASNSQPFSHIHTPGPAVGGHCIPVYPRFYLWGDPEATIVRAARELNEGQPAYMVGLLDGLLGGLEGKRVVVLGASYRGGGVKETAFSGVFPMVAALREAGAEALVHDPLYTDEELTALGLTPYHYGEPVEGAILHTDHAEYRDLSAAQFPGVKALVDGRNVTKPELWTGVTRKVFGRG
ncbi:nucleotide sugar dehydrogenase [Carbonactinospora thermoautotrophica]|uniref:nucleotide sugar dehydrogenase n=1 Tax=Carbonactinospora thermoautotrophica TaxID=1469144 RepID=UPI00226E4794|nr:nucleotide sugar dehydrogenase [Carbonactinospora thermoautotrophica]MCX9190263.1 nucleotide sugar dehydrogenase [Carbonactinospora thermoautotrophica]